MEFSLSVLYQRLFDGPVTPVHIGHPKANIGAVSRLDYFQLGKDVYWLVLAAFTEVKRALGAVKVALGMLRRFSSPLQMQSGICIHTAQTHRRSMLRTVNNRDQDV
jgi:hypothetical protein